MKEYKILVRKWLTGIENGMPMRTMVGTMERETPRAYLMNLHGIAEPSSKCLHCNRKLTHPVSLLYGIGPICGSHFHINPVSEEELVNYIDEIKAKMESVVWKGWVPKSQIVEMEEVESDPPMIVEEPKFNVKFKYDGQTYRTTTNSEKLYEIRQNAEILELEQII